MKSRSPRHNVRNGPKTPFTGKTFARTPNEQRRQKPRERRGQFSLSNDASNVSYPHELLDSGFEATQLLALDGD
jgi:hypothetical protein